MTLGLTADLEQEVEPLAQAMGRPANELAEEAIWRYLDEVKMRTDEVHETKASADRDGWLTTDEVFARFNLRKTE